MSIGEAQQQMLQSLFAAIDAKDTAAFLDHLNEGATFRFGSAPAAIGKAQIRDAVDGFFSTIAGLKHQVSLSLASGSDLVCEGDVRYSRHDGITITLPFVDVFNLDDGKITHYKIYMDIAPLYADQVTDQAIGA